MNEELRKKYEEMAQPSETTNLVTGEQEKYLPHRVQMAWFRDEYPTGRVISTVLDCERGKYARVRTEVFRSHEDSSPITSCEAERWVGKNGKTNISPVAWAQTAAEARALQNAGFGILCSVDADLPLPEVIDVDAVIQGATPKEEESPKKKESRSKKTNTEDAILSEEEVPTIVENSGEITEDKALEIKWPYGPTAMKDKKLGTLLREGSFGKRQIEWVLAAAQDRPSDLVKACQILQKKLAK